MTDSPDASPGPDEMYCSECGGVIARSATFCPECGAQHGGSSSGGNRVHSTDEHLPYWHDDGVFSRYVKFWGDKRLIYQILDLLMLVVSAGFFIGWIGMEAVKVHNKNQDWDGASKYYADIEEGELVRT
jgi:hypothetical protein